MAHTGDIMTAGELSDLSIEGILSVDWRAIPVEIFDSLAQQLYHMLRSEDTEVPRDLSISQCDACTSPFLMHVAGFMCERGMIPGDERDALSYYWCAVHGGDKWAACHIGTILAGGGQPDAAAKVYRENLTPEAVLLLAQLYFSGAISGGPKCGHDLYVEAIMGGKSSEAIEDDYAERYGNTPEGFRIIMVYGHYQEIQKRAMMENFIHARQLIVGAL